MKVALEEVSRTAMGGATIRLTKTVVIIQRRMTHYRIPLFNALRALLRNRGIELRVLYGVGTPSEISKGDAAALPWGEVLSTRYFLGGRICWQPFWSRVSDVDLVVITQENKLINNLPVLLWRNRRFFLAFWGHGRNMQSARPNGILERFKRWTTNAVDWWFAYTSLSEKYIRLSGFPPSRITSLNNSIDTAGLTQSIRSAQTLGQEELRRRVGCGRGPLGVYIGSLYAEKRIDFLLDAATRLRTLIPDFELLVAGDGPDKARVLDAASNLSYVHYAGGVSGARKAEILATACIVLNPGLVGLGILDSFSAGKPLLTTDCGLHSPEIAYLESGVNGLMTEDSLDDYVAQVARVIADRRLYSSLCAGAEASSSEFSIDRMAERFADGIGNCLFAPKA